MTVIPCAFMGAVTLSYILMAEEGFKLSASIAYPAGIAFAVLILILYFVKVSRVFAILSGKIKPKKTEVI